MMDFYTLCELYDINNIYMKMIKSKCERLVEIQDRVLQLEKDDDVDIHSLNDLKDIISFKWKLFKYEVDTLKAFNDLIFIQ